VLLVIQKQTFDTYGRVCLQARCSPLITQERDSTKVRKHSLHRSLKSIKLQVRLGCANACPAVKSVLNPAMVLWRDQGHAM